jgi:uncharacterized protein
VKFWDASAVVPLAVEESRTRVLRELLGEDREMMVWWATEVEGASAIARLERAGELTEADANTARHSLDELAGTWIEVDPTMPIRQAARRLVAVHPLRAADAFQLSAAIVASEGERESLPFVTLDQRLVRAAALEGFPVVDQQQV